ncbi:hypothetical protein AMP9_4284 [plant metagenome]|uniref:Uncharacterized protein n=1 Tax=plant metagenome TaxID=1297885 RepID=A0A484PBC4_9ZZZZ
MYLQSGVQRGRLARHCGMAGRLFFCFVAARLAAQTTRGMSIMHLASPYPQDVLHPGKPSKTPLHDAVEPIVGDAAGPILDLHQACGHPALDISRPKNKTPRKGFLPGRVLRRDERISPARRRP